MESPRAPLVGVVTTSYPRHADDFAGGFVRERVRALVRAGAEVEVIAAGEPGFETREGGGFETTEPGVRVTRVPFALPGAAPLFYGAGGPEALERGGPSIVASAVRFCAGLLGAVRARAGGWDRIESHWLLPCALAVSLAAEARGRPHRACAHSGDVALLERLPGGRTAARRLAAGPALIFASGALRDRFVALVGGEGVCRVPPVVEPAPVASGFAAMARDPAARRRARALLGLHGPCVLAVGRLVPIKGFDRLTLATGRLPRAARPVLIVLGEGPERRRLARLAAVAGVDLRLPGVVPAAIVREHLAAADLYVQPSLDLPNGRSEGTPVATLEALATGIPTLVSATGGLTTLPSVRVVPPGDVAALACAVGDALERAKCVFCFALETECRCQVRNP